MTWLSVYSIVLPWWSFTTQIVLFEECSLSDSAFPKRKTRVPEMEVQAFMRPSSNLATSWSWWKNPIYADSLWYFIFISAVWRATLIVKHLSWCDILSFVINRLPVVFHNFIKSLLFIKNEHHTHLNDHKSKRRKFAVSRPKSQRTVSKSVSPDKQFEQVRQNFSKNGGLE